MEIEPETAEWRAEQKALGLLSSSDEEEGVGAATGSQLVPAAGAGAGVCFAKCGTWTATGVRKSGSHDPVICFSRTDVTVTSQVSSHAEVLASAVKFAVSCRTQARGRPCEPALEDGDGKMGAGWLDGGRVGGETSPPRSR